LIKAFVDERNGSISEMSYTQYLFNLQPEIRQSPINVGNKQLRQIRKRETNFERKDGLKANVRSCLIAYLFNFRSFSCTKDKMLTGQIKNQNSKKKKCAR